MKTTARLLLTLAFGCPVVSGAKPMVDVVIYGCTPAGITAAIELRHSGKSVDLICRDAHIGGMTTNGLGFADTGNHGAIGGMARQFYRDVKAYYAARGIAPIQGQTKSAEDDGMWVFEPHVAEEIFERWLFTAGVTPVRSAPLHAVVKKGTRILSLKTTGGKTFSGRIFIDASYEGDLMADAAVNFAVGREANAVFGETLNGIQTVNAVHHQFDLDVDPYLVPGNAASGLLPRIERGPAGTDGTGDTRIQAYTYRLCMTKRPENRTPFPKPANYDARQYELLGRYLDAGWRELFKKFDPIPNDKTDTNNHGAFSMDDIGMNYPYPTASDPERRHIEDEHRTYQQGLLWFMQNDPRSPPDVRAAMQPWGLCKDEYTDNNNWPHELYVREARRMMSDFVMTERHLRGLVPTPYSIGLGSYTIDSHNVRRYVDARGFARNEGDVQVDPGRSYEISYGAIVPRRTEADNLLVPVALSASHIAYGSIRMEPVFMILGQSAAAAATLAVDQKLAVQDVPYASLRRQLLNDGQILEVGNNGLRPPSGGKGVGDYSLHDFAAKWMMQLDDLAEISHYADANRALLAHSDRRPRTVFIGDSITENWKALDAHGTSETRWVNRGINGSNTSQMLLRFEDDAVALTPYTIVIMGGTNDLRAYEGAPASVVDGAFARVTRNLTAMADIAAARGIKVVLCAIPPVGRDIDRIARDPAGVRRINAWIAAFARQRGFGFVDFGSVLADGEDYMKTELSADGIHPNDAGYSQMMPLIDAAVADAARR